MITIHDLVNIIFSGNIELSDYNKSSILTQHSIQLTRNAMNEVQAWNATSAAYSFYLNDWLDSDGMVRMVLLK